jgi:hypothetical protein
MKELLSLVPTGISGWALLLVGLFVTPLLTAIIRDHVTKPVTTWLGRQALWVVTWGFKSSLNSLYRDVARRKIVPAGVLIYLIFGFVSSGVLGYAVSMYNHSKKPNSEYKEKLDKMTLGEINAEIKELEEKGKNDDQQFALLLIGVFSITTIVLTVSGLRQKIVSVSILDFEHRLALCLDNISLQDERMIRAAFARIKSHEDYITVMNQIINCANNGVSSSPVQTMENETS